MPFFLAHLPSAETAVTTVDRSGFATADEAEAAAQRRYPKGRYLVVEAAYAMDAALQAERLIAAAAYRRVRERNRPHPFSRTDS